MSFQSAIVGVSDHCGWAVLMTVGADHRLLDRRRIELVAKGLPSLPYHHDAQGLPAEQGEALVRRVQQSAEECAAIALGALAESIPATIRGIALRALPKLPECIAERIASYHAQTRADGVMYRQALAKAATERGWQVHWFEPRFVFEAAETALRRGTMKELLKQTVQEFGRPWQKDHQLAMAAAIAAPL